MRSIAELTHVYLSSFSPSANRLCVVASIFWLLPMRSVYKANIDQRKTLLVSSTASPHSEKELGQQRSINADILITLEDYAMQISCQYKATDWNVGVCTLLTSYVWLLAPGALSLYKHAMIVLLMATILPGFKKNTQCSGGLHVSVSWHFPSVGGSLEWNIWVSCEPFILSQTVVTLQTVDDKMNTRAIFTLRDSHSSFALVVWSEAVSRQFCMLERFGWVGCILAKCICISTRTFLSFWRCSLIALPLLLDNE